jgi:hypothetical protein
MVKQTAGKVLVGKRVSPDGRFLYRLPDGRFHVECGIDICFERIGFHGSLEVVPVLECGDFRLELPMLVLMGWRRYLGFVLSAGGHGACLLPEEYRIGRIVRVSFLDCLFGRVHCRYEADIGYQPWMDSAGVRIARD